MSTLFYPLASLFQYFVVRADFATKVTKRECKKKIKFKYIVDRNGFCRIAGLKIKNTYMSVTIKEKDKKNLASLEEKRKSSNFAPLSEYSLTGRRVA